ncbi:DUF421 domain-containing protein [Porifericola rhodea]|uniref:DUF421 domain-containing protein n=1 Tax=Porifericola rhodea TaxID=930972 RepID=UPI002665F5AB|nr:YetF domain-containing protein [Porifericola rhodea]WKN30023.1 DUF421 domain-containing protein [Porifericola rhodea]
MNIPDLFWDGSGPILRIIIVGSLTYFGIVLLLRSTGKRTLTNMSAFDFIVTLAIGSTFGRVLTAKDVTISEGLTAFLLLIMLQYLVTSLGTRFKLFSKLVSSSPTLLYYQGEYLKKNMKKERVSEKDLLSAVRRSQLNSLDEVEAIIMESEGSVSVIKKTLNQSPTTLSYKHILDE